MSDSDLFFFKQSLFRNFYKDLVGRIMFKISVIHSKYFFDNAFFLPLVFLLLPGAIFSFILITDVHPFLWFFCINECGRFRHLLQPFPDFRRTCVWTVSRVFMSSRRRVADPIRSGYFGRIRIYGSKKVCYGTKFWK